MEKTRETPLERARRLVEKNWEEILETERVVMGNADPIEAQIADLRRRVEALEKRARSSRKRRTKR